MISFNAMEAARSAGAKQFFYASSACVYNESKQEDPNNPGLKEGDAWPAKPQDAYGLEKLCSEELCMHYGKDFGIQGQLGSGLVWLLLIAYSASGEISQRVWATRDLDWRKGKGEIDWLIYLFIYWLDVTNVMKGSCCVLQKGVREQGLVWGLFGFVFFFFFELILLSIASMRFFRFGGTASRREASLTLRIVWKASWDWWWAYFSIACNANTSRRAIIPNQLIWARTKWSAWMKWPRWCWRLRRRSTCLWSTSQVGDCFFVFEEIDVILFRTGGRTREKQWKHID